jgi:hypothetical protein
MCIRKAVGIWKINTEVHKAYKSRPGMPPCGLIRDCRKGARTQAFSGLEPVRRPNNCSSSDWPSS